MSASHLVIVAHPDDETIFFGGTILSLRNRAWRVIVVTDGNADGDGPRRRAQLAKACETLGVRKFEQWDFPDIYERRLDTSRLLERLKDVKTPRVVFTHGIIGEYGHPHHQDVSWAVHKHFMKTQIPVWSAAYNSFPTKIVRLTRKSYEKKAKILSQIYQTETIRFARFLPVLNQEGFHRAEWSEIDSLYSFFTGASNTPDSLKIYKWFQPYLEEQKKAAQERRF